MKKKRILITAGPTREMLDPIRFISNVSTGEMGYSLAQVASRKKWDVTLVSGPTALKPPAGCQLVSITSSAELQKECQKQIKKNDVLVMVAAVCDFTVKKKFEQKIRRQTTKTLTLKRTPDIVAGLAASKRKKIIIGFCLETQNWLDNAKKKLKRKKLDGIVANYYTKTHTPFGNRRINTAFIGRDGKVKHLKNKTKKMISTALLNWVEELAKKGCPKG